MDDDLISREALINAKPEFMNEKVVRDTKYQTSKDRIYAKAWNACNSYWLDTIINARAVEEIEEPSMFGGGKLMSNFKPVHVVRTDGGKEYVTEEIINFDYVVRICPYYAKNTLGKTQIFFQDQPMWTSTVITEHWEELK